MRQHLSVLSAALLLACSPSSLNENTESSESLLSTDAGTQTLLEITDFGANPGKLKMFEYAPAKLPAAGAAVVLVMHGCNHGAADVAKTGWNDIADQLGSFVVVYPEQVTTNNAARCFNWGGVYGDLSKIERGKEENQSIKDMVDKAVALHKADAKKVFVVGFSAGGGEAAIMAAAWPDVFAAGATIAGIPYHCNTTFAEAFSCQKPGKDKTPAEWATLAKAAAPTGTTTWPRMSIWQGAVDSIVSPTNRVEMLEQWTEVHGVGQTPSVTDTVDGAAHTVFKDKAGKIVVESYEVPGMDHGVSVVPSKKCGSTAQSSYGLDKGICTAARIAEFFGLSAATGPAADAGAKTPVTTSSTSTSSSGSADAAAGNNGSSSSGAAAPAKGAEDNAAGSTCSFSSRAATNSASSCFTAALFAIAIGSIFTRRSRRNSNSNSSTTRSPR